MNSFHLVLLIFLIHFYVNNILLCVYSMFLILTIYFSSLFNVIMFISFNYV